MEPPQLTVRDLRILLAGLSLAARWEWALHDGYDLSGLSGPERRTIQQAMRTARRAAARYEKLSIKVQQILKARCS